MTTLHKCSKNIYYPSWRNKMKNKTIYQVYFLRPAESLNLSHLTLRLGFNTLTSNCEVSSEVSREIQLEGWADLQVSKKKHRSRMPILVCTHFLTRAAGSMIEPFSSRMQNEHSTTNSKTSCTWRHTCLNGPQLWYNMSQTNLLSYEIINFLWGEGVENTFGIVQS